MKSKSKVRRKSKPSKTKQRPPKKEKRSVKKKKKAGGSKSVERSKGKLPKFKPATTSLEGLRVGDVHNAYPELPELPFERTTVAMATVVTYISQTAATVPVKRAAYVIFRNESAAGQKGINNNYIGLQADGARQAPKWTPFIAGTCVHAENTTGKLRRFICLKNWATCIDILAEKVSVRGLYVGGYAHPYANMQINSNDDWPLAYWREWVQGDGHAQIPDAEKRGLLAQYATAVREFP